LVAVAQPKGGVDMAEFTNAGVQTVAPGETVVFSESALQNANLVYHMDGTGNFLLIPRGCNCGRRREDNFLVSFGANIAIPEGGTVEPISLALALNGATLPATTMEVTPAAVNQYFNVARVSNVPVFARCCQTLVVRNTSSQPILVSAANIVIERAYNEWRW